MRDTTWGSYATRLYHIRWLTPLNMHEYALLNGWVFTWRKFTPRTLFHAARQRLNWQWLLRLSQGVNGRCYCDEGWQFRWFVQIAGFGFNLWVSHYGGPDPCPCDEIVEEIPATDEHG